MRDPVWRDKNGHPRQLKSMITIQREHLPWREYNFPNQVPHQPILGVVEEIGELAHAVLKREQGIRGSAGSGTCASRAAASGSEFPMVDDVDEKIDDAIGDIMIYLFSYCNMTDRNLLVLANKAWDGVRQRDWVQWPATGMPPEPIKRPTTQTRVLQQRIAFLEADLKAEREQTEHWKKIKDQAFKSLNEMADLVQAPVPHDEDMDECHSCGTRVDVGPNGYCDSCW